MIKSGKSTLVLTGANTYSGGTTITGGTLSVPSDAMLGDISGTVTVGPVGSLNYSQSTTTGRTIILQNSSLAVTTGATLTLAGGTVAGGFLRGSFATAGPLTSTIAGATTYNTTTLAQGGQTSLTNFTNGGTLNNNADGLIWDGGFNNAGGTFNVNHAVSVDNFLSSGAINISGSGASIANTAGDLILGGGSRTYIGSVAAPSGTIATPAGTSIQVNGGLLVNNGTITGTTNVNYGGTAEGAGTFGPVNVTSGGVFHPGNSPGTANTGTATWASGGGYLFEIEQAAGSPGTDYSQWRINGSLDVTSGAAGTSPFVIDVVSLTRTGAPGSLGDFNPSQSYSWEIATTRDGINGLNPSNVVLDTAGFQNDPGGNFSLSSDGQNLFVDYTAVPEPAMIGLLPLAFGLLARRRRCAV